MTTITNFPAIKKFESSALKGDVFYGSFKTTLKGKSIDVNVSNHLQDGNKQYKFRVAANLPKYWVVWPHSESKGWCDRLTGTLNHNHVS